MATLTVLNIDRALDEIIGMNAPAEVHRCLPNRTTALAQPKKTVTFADPRMDRLKEGSEDLRIAHDDLFFYDVKRNSSAVCPFPALAKRKIEEVGDEESEEEDEDWRMKRGRGAAPSPEPTRPTVVVQDWSFDIPKPPPSGPPLVVEDCWMDDGFSPVLTSVPELVPGPAFAEPNPPLYAPSQDIVMQTIDEPWWQDENVAESMPDYGYYEEIPIAPEPAPEPTLQPISQSIELPDYEVYEKTCSGPEPATTPEMELDPELYPEQTPFENALAAFLNCPLEPAIVETLHPINLITTPHLWRYALMMEELLANGAFLYSSVNEHRWAAIYRAKLEEFALIRADGTLGPSEAFVDAVMELEQEQMARNHEMQQAAQYEDEMRQLQQQEQEHELEAIEQEACTYSMQKTHAGKPQHRHRHRHQHQHQRQQHQRRQERTRKKTDRNGERKQHGKERHRTQKKRHHQSQEDRIPTGPRADTFGIKGAASRRERY